MKHIKDTGSDNIRIARFIDLQTNTDFCDGKICPIENGKKLKLFVPKVCSWPDYGSKNF